MEACFRLILFDIDGTLITTGGAGVHALERAFHTLFDIKDAVNSIPMAGKTDVQIIKEVLGLHGLSYLDGNVKKMQEMYLHYLQEEICNRDKKLKPGVKELLNLLKNKDIPLGLLTGNLERGAKIKLHPFNLNEYFIDGAFGSDHEDRDELLPIAIDKFRRKGFTFTPKQCIIIGDTPRDVRCAKIHGARCIAVATGPYSKEELLTTDADMVLDSLSETEQYLTLLTGNTELI